MHLLLYVTERQLFVMSQYGCSGAMRQSPTPPPSIPLSLGMCSPSFINELSFYGIRNVGGAAYVMRIPGYGRAGATPRTARSSLVPANEA
jgi:hypothetical protein